MPKEHRPWALRQVARPRPGGSAKGSAWRPCRDRSRRAPKTRTGQGCARARLVTGRPGAPCHCLGVVLEHTFHAASQQMTGRARAPQRRARAARERSSGGRPASEQRPICAEYGAEHGATCGAEQKRRALRHVWRRASPASERHPICAERGAERGATRGAEQKHGAKRRSGALGRRASARAARAGRGAKCSAEHWRRAWRCALAPSKCMALCGARATPMQRPLSAHGPPVHNG